MIAKKEWMKKGNEVIALGKHGKITNVVENEALGTVHRFDVIVGTEKFSKPYHVNDVKPFKEVRTVKQTKVFKLILHPIDNDLQEDIAAIAFTGEELIELISMETVIKYQDGPALRSFRKGGMLERFDDYRSLSQPMIEWEWSSPETINQLITTRFDLIISMNHYLSTGPIEPKNN